MGNGHWECFIATQQISKQTPYKINKRNVTCVSSLAFNKPCATVVLCTDKVVFHRRRGHKKIFIPLWASIGLLSRNQTAMFNVSSTIDEHVLIYFKYYITAPAMLSPVLLLCHVIFCTGPTRYERLVMILTLNNVVLIPNRGERHRLFCGANDNNIWFIPTFCWNIRDSDTLIAATMSDRFHIRISKTVLLVKTV